MGGNGSTARKVSFGLDEEEKVTVIEGVKLSDDVLRRMRETQGSCSSMSPPAKQDHHKTSSLKPSSPSTTGLQEEIRRNFENQQTLVQEQVARLAQRDRETGIAVGLDDLSPSLIVAKEKAWEEQEKAKILNLDTYQQTAEQYNQAATKAEAHIRPWQTVSVCSELQAKVLQCYRENPQQTLLCSSLAKQYMTCVQQAKKVVTRTKRPEHGSLTNHG
ncbi:MICOS complex subunit mic25a-like isoform X4 [Syngnathoides biaculeatus]|uniref:MICOS complex subunit mic25a-like isoform X4 n=1 Tax=Syngnathoides biaculeatus TaxID=300417 RepID=UPI002ADE03C5|nr:MICOS complex subunit mic25a-like isoform X4 [Syngnathoides biaculeatus]